MKTGLSKSRYTYALSCPKKLWLLDNCPEEAVAPQGTEAERRNGEIIGELARHYFGDDYRLIAQTHDLAKMCAETQEAMDEGLGIICEASFEYQGLFCSADLIEWLGGKRLRLYEVKSATSLKDYYYDDVAFQLYVIEKCGYTVEAAFVMHVNGDYVRHGELNLTQLFTVRDVTANVRMMQSGVDAGISQILQQAAAEIEPFAPLTEACLQDGKCPWFGHCTKGLPEPNVFSLFGTKADKKIRLFRSGCVSFEDLSSCPDLTTSEAVQVSAGRNGEPVIDREAVADFFRKVKYPLYYLDFESYQSPFPQFDGSRAFEQIPFQYSLHYQLTEDGELLHKEFLAPGDGTDPRRLLAESLCRDIPTDVCSMAYNMTFEKTVIKNLAALYPDLSGHLMNIYSNMIDLIVPFRSRAVYFPAQQGSFSIKHVLPALFPDDPSLDYSTLEGVKKGDQASATFSLMQYMPAEERVYWRKSLLEYCGLDTFAMVKLLEKLKEFVNDR